MVSITLFEGIILLVITGVFTVAWWGVKRIVRTNDDEAEVLDNINRSLKDICERLAATDVWMKMHTRLDDERHEENKGTLKDLKKIVEDLNRRA